MKLYVYVYDWNTWRGGAEMGPRHHRVTTLVYTVDAYARDPERIAAERARDWLLANGFKDKDVLNFEYHVHEQGYSGCSVVRLDGRPVLIPA